MNISGFYAQKLGFGEQEKPQIIINGQNDANKLSELNAKLNSIIRKIGGIGLNSDNLSNIDIALAKIELLKRETQNAWENCPSALKQKLDRLDSLKNELCNISVAISETNAEIDSKPQNTELLMPQEKPALITGMDAISAYNLLKRKPVDTRETEIKKLYGDALRQDELENSLRELKKDNWSFEKLNSDDSKIYPKLSKQLLIGDIKNTVEKQVEIIDEKLVQLKTDKGTFVSEVGVKVYDPKTTGQILALETAKLRRLSVQNPISAPNIDQKLSDPNILAQPIPTDSPVFFKIDKRFIPKNFEIQQILKLNEPFKPVLNKLFPEGLNVYMVPGYTDDKMGDIEGGISIPDYPDNGVWLNSYDYKERYNYTSQLEKVLGTIRSVNNIKPSVLRGSNDRARALSHEISHAIAYKLENNYQQENNQKDSGVLLTGGNISFMDGWKILRTGAQYNDKSLKTYGRLMTNDSLNNLRQFFEYESSAEDIRQALTSENLPASSSMTGIFDQTKKGGEQLAKVKTYIQKCLLEDKSPSEIIFNHISSDE